MPGLGYVEDPYIQRQRTAGCFVVPSATVPVIVAAFVLPTKDVAVIVFAVKLPDASRAAIVDAPVC